MVSSSEETGSYTGKAQRVNPSVCPALRTFTPDTSLLLVAVCLPGNGCHILSCIYFNKLCSRRLLIFKGVEESDRQVRGLPLHGRDCCLSVLYVLYLRSSTKPQPPGLHQRK